MDTVAGWNTHYPLPLVRVWNSVGGPVVVVKNNRHEECAYCGSWVEKLRTNCPNCGAPLMKGREE